MSEVIFYSRAGCHLCEAVEAEVTTAAQAAGLAFRKVDVDTDPDLLVQFGVRVPVVVYRETVLDEGRVDPAKVRDYLAAAVGLE
ncbi:MAG: glutaredoxin family protein [Pseudomonadota bacterium]